MFGSFKKNQFHYPNSILAEATVPSFHGDWNRIDNPQNQLILISSLFSFIALNNYLHGWKSLVWVLKQTPPATAAKLGLHSRCHRNRWCLRRGPLSSPCGHTFSLLVVGAAHHLTFWGFSF